MTREGLERTLQLYFDHGLVPIPIRFGAKSAALSWSKYQRATLTPELEQEIRADFERVLERDGAANVGLVCGSPLLVLDVDNFDQFLRWLKGRGYLLSRSTTVKTRKGLHLYFRAPEGVEVRRCDRVRETGAELRGYGHYVVAPYSVVDGHMYQFLQGLELARFGLVEPPDWVLKEFVEQSPTPALDEVLAEQVVLPKVVELLYPYWREGDRHVLALGLAGYLRKHGVEQEHAERCIAELCIATGDRESADRIRAVRDTYAETGAVAGASLLVERLPGEVLAELERLLGRPKLNGSTAAVRLLTLDELHEKIQRQMQADWLVEGVLRQGDIVIVAGRPKTGKSIFAAALAHAINTGSEFLGRKVRQAVVVYLDLERVRVTVERLQRMGDTRLLRFPENPLRLDGLEALRGAVEDLKREYGLPVVVVVDTLGDFIAPVLSKRRTSINDYDAVGQALQQLREFSASTGATFLLVHHTHKAGLKEGEESELLGSTGIPAKVDVIALLYAEREHEGVLRLCVSGNDVERQTLYYTVRDDFTLEPTEAPERTKVRAAARAIRELLEKEGELRRADLLYHLQAEGLADNESAAKTLFHRAAEELQLVSRRVGREAMYSLRRS